METEKSITRGTTHIVSREKSPKEIAVVLNETLKKIEAMMSHVLDHIEQPLIGFNTSWLICGIITAQQLQIVTSLIMLLMQLILFLTKMFYAIRNNKLPEELEVGEAIADPNPANVLTWEKMEPPTQASTPSVKTPAEMPYTRSCGNCREQFVPQNSNQLFCSGECRGLFYTEPKSRR